MRYADDVVLIACNISNIFARFKDDNKLSKPRLLRDITSSSAANSGSKELQEGLMEFAGVDKAARSKMGVWKMQEWTYRHDMATVDIAGMDNAAPYGRGGLCRSGQISTMWQG